MGKYFTSTRMVIVIIIINNITSVGENVEKLESHILLVEM